MLQQELEKEKKRVDFCLDRFKDDDSKIRFYTGFTTHGMLMACYTFLLPSAKIMRTWKGKRTSVGERTTKEKCEPEAEIVSSRSVIHGAGSPPSWTCCGRSC